MALNSFARFYYGLSIDTTNNKVNFSEGAGELTATLTSGGYTFEEFADEIERSMSSVGGQAYTVTTNRVTRRLTIAAAGNFTLKISTGSNTGISSYPLMGFTGADVTGTNTYAGNTECGSEYTPQFKLQDYISSDDWQESVSVAVNESASGTIETVSFGTRSFVQMNIKYISDKLWPTNGNWINNPSGVADARAFLQSITQKVPVEFMPDKDAPITFQKLLLEKTPVSKNGTGYILKELYDRNLPDIYETGVLVFRVQT